MSRPKVIIDLAQIRDNAERLARRLPPQVGFYGVVKADAYGHGLAETAEVLCSVDELTGFAVFDPEEALAIRETGWQGDILCLRPLYGDELSLALQLDVSITIGDLQHAKEASQLAAKGCNGHFDSCEKLGPRRSRKVNCHLDIDTGLSRFGREADEVLTWIPRLPRMERIKLRYVWTHLANGWTDPESARRQLNDVERFRRRGNVLSVPKHLGGSDAILLSDSLVAGDAMRCGRAMYGVHPGMPDLKPAMSFVATVIARRSIPGQTPIGYGDSYRTRRATEIVIIGAGLADGLPKSMSNRGIVLIGGQRCPILGQIGMNNLAADVTHVPKAQVGDEAVIFGQQDSALLHVEEVAKRAGTKATDLLVKVGCHKPCRLRTHKAAKAKMSRGGMLTPSNPQGLPATWHLHDAHEGSATLKPK